jgi:hypothetical protein
MYKTNQIWAAGIAVLTVTIACIGSTVPTAAPNAVDTIVAATMRAITPANTATPLPSATPLSTPTFVIPTLPPVGSTLVPPAATRINFLSKATTGVVSGPIQPGQIQYFVINASQGQPMIVMVNSLNNDVTLSVRTQGGTWMLNAAAHQTAWQSMLPKTEDYYIGIYGGATTENFTLTVQIPSRIKFAQGSITATVSGQTVAGYNVAYTVLAIKSQLMTVNLNGVANSAALTIYGYSDGQPYLRSVTGQTSFNFKLPATQDYIIEVVPRAGQVVNYTLVVIIK